MMKLRHMKPFGIIRTMVLKFKSWVILFVVFGCVSADAQFPEVQNNLDRKIKAFLEENVSNWRDMNIPLSDGRLLYDIIVENGYTRAVEIGTSTGHSAIWIAWALSKTGGKHYY